MRPPALVPGASFVARLPTPESGTSLAAVAYIQVRGARVEDVSEQWGPEVGPVHPPGRGGIPQGPPEPEDLGERLRAGPEGLAHPDEFARAGPGGPHRGGPGVHAHELAMLRGAGGRANVGADRGAGNFEAVEAGGDAAPAGKPNCARKKNEVP